MNIIIFFSILILSTSQSFFACSLPEKNESLLDHVPRRSSAGSNDTPNPTNLLFHEWPGQSSKVYPINEVIAISTCTCQQIAKPRFVTK